MDAYPPVGDAKTAAALPELPWMVIPAEDIAEVLERLKAWAREPIELPEEDSDG